MKMYLRGFTLIELLAVLAILAIIATASISSYRTYNVRAKLGTIVPLLEQIAKENIDYYQSNGIWPPQVITCNNSSPCKGYDYLQFLAHEPQTTSDSKSISRISAGIANLDSSLDGDFFYLEVTSENGIIHRRCTRSTTFSPDFLPDECSTVTLTSWDI